MSDKHIDDIVKDALQDLNVPYRPESWDAMQQRLDGIETDAAFDEHINAQMNNMHAAYAPALWDSMQKRMDVELNDEVFDDSIKSQLTEVDATYRHKHWLQLKEWLDYQWFASNKVYVSKSAEAGLMLLALFTFFNYNTGLVEPIQPTAIFAQSEVDSKIGQKTDHTNFNESAARTHEGLVEAIAEHESLERQSSERIEKSNANSNIKAEENSGADDRNENVALLDVGQRANNSNGVTAKTNHLNDDAEVYVMEQTQARSTIGILVPLSTELNDLNVEQDEFKNLNFNPLQPIETKKQKRKRALARAEIGSQNEDRLTEGINEIKSSFVSAGNHSSLMTSANDLPLFAMTSTNNLPLLAMSHISNVGGNGFEALVSANDIGIKFPEDKKWAFSTFVDIDFNQISTPYDKLYEKNGYNQNRIGIGGGLMLHRDLGPVEVSTGVSYSSKQYNPKEFIEFNKKNLDSDGTAYRLNRIKLNVLTVPIHAAHYITKKGNWRPYIVGGGAVHLALQAQYEKESEPVPSSVPVDQFLDENEGATYTEGQANFEQINFQGGLLGDGLFKENHYFTLDIGVGIERKLTPSTSFFVQPTVYYNLFNKGLSANNDKINTFSLQIGTKTRF